MKFNLTTKVAELAGLFAADGSMQKEHICFWGSLIQDRQYYDNIVKNLFKHAFNIEVNPHEKPSNSVYGFYVCKKEIISYFHNKLDFPIGKKTYTVRIPEIIMNSKKPEIWSAFVRGFADGDGCLNFDKRYAKDQTILKIIHTYPHIFIKSVSHNVIKDISKLLDRLNIKHSSRIQKATRKNEANYSVLTVFGKKNLVNWMKVISFNNPVQVSRYNIFNKHGFVPSNTSFKEREGILQGKICPWNYYPPNTRNLIKVGDHTFV